MAGFAVSVGVSVGLLDGGIQSIMGSAFGWLYLPGILTRVTLIDDGHGGGSEAVTEQPCRVQVDACTEAMRQQAGYTATDVRLLILQAGVTGGNIKTDDRVTVSGLTFEIASVGPIDPGSSYWECRATKIAV